MVKQLLQQIDPLLTHMKAPIELLIDRDSSQAGENFVQLAEGLERLSPLISVREGDLRRAPSIELRRQGSSESQITFACFPGGHEATTFLLALLNLADHPSREDEALQSRIRSIQSPLHFKLWLSQSCHNCPSVAQAINLMAILNSNVTVELIDGSLFPKEAEDENVQSVPSLFLNGELFNVGRITLAELLDKLEREGHVDTIKLSTDLDPSDHYDTLVIGSGPAGATAAIYTARKGLSVAIVGDRLGGQLNETADIQNYTGFSHITGEGLTREIQKHLNDYPITLMDGAKVNQVMPGKPHTVILNTGRSITTDALIVATGARWKKLGIEGEDAFSGKGVAYCPHCDGPLYKGKSVAVIGGGNSGVEAAIDLAAIVNHVTLVVRGQEMKADAVLQDAIRSLNNVTILYNHSPNKFVGNETLSGLVCSTPTGLSTIEVQGAFVQIGLIPNTDFMEGVVELNAHGGIVVDANQRTSVKGIYAAGDCTSVEHNQIIISAGSGAAAALSAHADSIRR